jgi:Domain of unknown function (DUF5615)
MWDRDRVRLFSWSRTGIRHRWANRDLNINGKPSKQLIQPQREFIGLEARLRPYLRLIRFLIDRCAGQLLADWLRKQGHDVVESRELGPDPGDRALLDWASKETRILVTIDADFGELIYLENLS